MQSTQSLQEFILHQNATTARLRQLKLEEKKKSIYSSAQSRYFSNTPRIYTPENKNNGLHTIYSRNNIHQVALLGGNTSLFQQDKTSDLDDWGISSSTEKNWCNNASIQVE